MYILSYLLMLVLELTQSIYLQAKMELIVVVQDILQMLEIIMMQMVY